MNVGQKLLSGLLLSGLISVSGATAFQGAIAQKTEPVIQTATEKNIDEYESTCARWQGQTNKFSRRHIYGWFDFSDSRWAGKPVKEIDFWYVCMRNTFQMTAGVEQLGEELGAMCDRIGEDEEFHQNWVRFPQFTTLSHEFRTDKIGEEFHAYSCRIVVQPSFGRTSVDWKSNFP